MDNLSAQLDTPWSGFGHLDSHYRAMLSLPDSALNGNMAELLAEASFPGLTGASVVGEQLSRTEAPEDLPPVIDFSDFLTSQQAEQPYSGILPSLDDSRLPQLHSGLPEIPVRSARHTSQPKAISALHLAGKHGVLSQESTLSSTLFQSCTAVSAVIAHVQTLPWAACRQPASYQAISHFQHSTVTAFPCAICRPKQPLT